jgi:hypothetical protein
VWLGLRGATVGTATASSSRPMLIGSQASGEPAKTWS